MSTDNGVYMYLAFIFAFVCLVALALLSKPRVVHEPPKPGDIMKVTTNGLPYMTNVGVGQVYTIRTPKLYEPRLIRFELGQNYAIDIDEQYLVGISNWVRTNWIEKR